MWMVEGDHWPVVAAAHNDAWRHHRCPSPEKGWLTLRWFKFDEVWPYGITTTRRTRFS
jgi:hypothetical protein